MDICQAVYARFFFLGFRCWLIQLSVRGRLCVRREISCELFSDNTSEAVEKLQRGSGMKLSREIDNSTNTFIDSFPIYGGCRDYILKRHSG